MIQCPKCGREFAKANCYGNHKKSCHRTAEQVSEDFWSWVDTSPGYENDDCWEWTGTLAGSGYVKGKGFKDGHGYGQFTSGGKKILAHKFAYEDSKEPVPDGQWVLHKCDNRKCCRPSHLFLGGCQANHDDMARKGRSTTKIPDSKVLEVVKDLVSGLSYTKIARKRGVTKSFVAHIANRRTRRHLTEGVLT